MEARAIRLELRRSVVYGDANDYNVLVGPALQLPRKVVSVIDFGDITSGDPAIDLAIGWMMLPGSCRGAFCDSYAAAGGRAAGDSSVAGWRSG